MNESEKEASGHDHEHGQGGSAVKAKVFIGVVIFVLCFIANVLTGNAAWVRVPLVILALSLVYRAWFAKSK